MEGFQWLLLTSIIIAVIVVVMKTEEIVFQWKERQFVKAHREHIHARVSLDVENPVLYLRNETNLTLRYVEVEIEGQVNGMVKKHTLRINSFCRGKHGTISTLSPFTSGAADLEHSDFTVSPLNVRVISFGSL